MNSWLVRNILLPWHERLMGRATFRCYRQLLASERWSAERLAELQLAKLRTLVGVALEQTEGYADLAGLDRSWRPNSLADLARLPLLNKATISQRREQLVNHSVPGGPVRYRTGGSSGVPLIFYFDKRRQAYDKAARMRTHLWHGVQPGDREAYIWNSPVELSKQDKLKHLRDWLTNEHIFPASDLSRASVAEFVRKLKAFRPKCLFGYPSAIHLLCRLAGQEGLRLEELGVKVVFSTAEVLYSHQKQDISAALGGVPVVDGYGSREAGFISHECEHGRLHITDENVIVEFLRDGRPVEPGQDGEIVVTHLDNHAMPFIRYRTGDVGQPSSESCPCGRSLATMQIVKGRSNDFLLTPDGRWIHGSAVHAALSDIPGIVTYQLIQRPDRHVRVLLVADGQFPAGAAERLQARLMQRLGAGSQVIIEYRDAIPPGPSGKFRYIISQLPEGILGEREQARAG